MLDENACYTAIQQRDSDADGLFYFAVQTTRIYCRPICPARTPLRQNVHFYRTAAEAQKNGYRPCLRCRPEAAPGSPAWLGSQSSVNRALRLIEEGLLADASVEELAEKLGMTGRHLRRLFVQHLGVTPKEMEQTRRTHLACKLLQETSLSITDIAFAAGYGSLRRLDDAFQLLFGTAPSQMRRANLGKQPTAQIKLLIPYRRNFPGFAKLGLVHDQEKDQYQVQLMVAGKMCSLWLSQGPAHCLRLHLDTAPIRDYAKIVAAVRQWVLRMEGREDQGGS